MPHAARWLLAVGIAALVVGAGDRAEAGLLVENLTGSFDAATTLGGVALGADTAFALQASFDTSTGSSFGNGIQYFSVISLTIDIAGHGTFIGIPSSALNVLLIDPSSFLGAYGVGLFDPNNSGFYYSFSTATPLITAAAPTATTFSGPMENNADGYTISLVGVTGGLAITDNSLGTAVATASLTAVPEPSSLALAGTAVTIAALGGGLLRGRRKQVG
jgi:hypothetical protein